MSSSKTIVPCPVTCLPVLLLPGEEGKVRVRPMSEDPSYDIEARVLLNRNRPGKAPAIPEQALRRALSDAVEDTLQWVADHPVLTREEALSLFPEAAPALAGPSTDESRLAG